MCLHLASSISPHWPGCLVGILFNGKKCEIPSNGCLVNMLVSVCWQTVVLLWTVSLLLKVATGSCRDPNFIGRTLTHGDAEALEILGGVCISLQEMEAGGHRPKSWEDCVGWARCKWETLYNNDIRQLLHCFPPGEVKSHLGWKQPYCQTS